MQIHLDPVYIFQAEGTPSTVPYYVGMAVLLASMSEQTVLQSVLKTDHWSHSFAPDPNKCSSRKLKVGDSGIYAL